MSRFLAIDVDHGTAHLVAGTARGGQVRLEKAITVPFAEPLSAANAAELGRQLRDALKTAGIAPGPTVAVVGRDRVILKDVKIPKVPAGEEPSVIRFQATKDMSEAADAVALDYYTLTREEADGQVRAVTATVRKDVLAAYRALCQAAGLRLVGVTARPLGALAALERAIATGAVTEPEAKRASVAVLTRGEKWGELVIARDGQVVFSRTISGTALNSEQMLLGELRRNLAVYNGQTPQQPVEALYVAEAAGPGGWSGRVRAGLTVPVQAFDPLAGVEHTTAPDARGHFSALAGLLQLKARGGPLPIDFAAPRQPVARNAASRKYVAAGAAVLALLIVGGLGFGYVKVQDRQKELAALVKEKNELDKLLKDLDEDKKRIGFLKEWDETRVSWLDEMYDLAARFPDIRDTQLTKFRVEPLPVPKGAKIKNVARISLTIQTADSKNVNDLQAEMNKDKHYHNVKKELKGGAGTFGFGRFQTYEIRTDIEKRPPGAYVRKLAVSAPTRPARDRDEGGEFGSGIGGGFPVFNGGPGQ